MVIQRRIIKNLFHSGFVSGSASYFYCLFDGLEYCVFLNPSKCRISEHIVRSI